MTNTPKHPDQAYPTPYLVGRWMVTGPEFEDGSGWSLCIHEDGKCQRCVATFSDQADAEHAAKLHDLWETRNIQIREVALSAEQIHAVFPSGWTPRTLAQSLRTADAEGRMAVIVDPAIPEGTIVIEKEGREVARMVNVGMAPEPQAHEHSGVRQTSGIPRNSR